MGTFSSVALAEASEGRISYAPADAIDLVLGKIKEAQEAIKSGADGETVAKIIKQGLDFSKEVNANDVVDRKRYKANDILKKARAAAKNSSMGEVDASLQEAAKAFADLKAYI